MSENNLNIIHEEPNDIQVKNKNKIIIIGALILILIIAFAGLMLFKKPVDDSKTLTVSNVVEIINIEELSTFTTTYKGIATVYDVAKIDLFTNVKYYVAYEAKVNVGIDLSKVTISLNDETKELLIKLPAVQINNIDVDMNSMDFMFQKDKYDKSGVSREAYSACNDDVHNEASTQEAIFELAYQNAVNIITALVRPVVSQIDASYTVVVK